MKTKQLFISLLTLTIILSGVSLAGAAGVWKNPTATPPGNNVEAPINVGNDAQDKSGVLRVTGFRSFFDAIFDTKVQIGTTANMPSSLKLLVDGKVGAEAYCDRQGENCVTSSGIPVSTNTSSGGGGSIGRPAYDSGWIDFQGAPSGGASYGSIKILNHKLGTLETLVDIEGKNDKDNVSTYFTTHANKPNFDDRNGLAWFDKTESHISIWNSACTANTGYCNRYIRVRMWK